MGRPSGSLSGIKVIDASRVLGGPYAGQILGDHGMELDLVQSAGCDVLLGLSETADIFVENFKTGTLDRWGMGPDELERRFPTLIHCRVSGFGADGPLGGLPGYDATIQALCGIMSVNGEQGGAPLRVGLPVVGMATGFKTPSSAS